MATLVELLAKKRDGEPHEPGEIRRLIEALVAGELADYQMTAWLMAVYLRGLEPRETLELTDAMLASGVVVDLSAVPGRKVDKHSTGGVGDKVSIALAPIVAACGVPVPMVSGRGLGHTGGTLDKLEAIPGFRVDLTIDDYRRIVGEVGTCLIGQTREIAPADKKIYALRDVTATVESIPLITASILSKKLAEGIDALVLDVKVGRGAFMKDLDRARALARSLVDVAARGGKGVTAILSDMDHPLGLAIGNALETREAIEVLLGGGPRDLVDLTIELAAEMLLLGGIVDGVEAGRARARRAIDDRSAADLLRRLIVAQAGDPRVVDEPDRLPRAPIVETIAADRAGVVADVDPLSLGLASIELGAGRTRADQTVDPAVGLLLRATKGERIEVGAPLVEVHARTREAVTAVTTRVKNAFVIAERATPRGPLVIDVLRAT
jgi:pyrimidine-nucleoside phosphorylase